MKKEMLLVVEAVSNEKDVPKEVIFEAMEAALASAIRKKLGADADIRVAIDRSTGEYQVFRRWEVVSDEACEVPERQRALSEAREQDANLVPGDQIEESMTIELGGRITAQAAKQVIVQRVREAERAKIVKAYRERKGELITGLVKRVDRGNVILDLGGNAEALIPRGQGIPRESVRPGDRLRGYLFEVRPEPKGPQLFVSRTAPELIIELFKLEVPEVGEGLIEILGAARDPGSRAKIAVRTRDNRIDPVGACVGMRGSRVQAVSNELNGERVDIILWNDNPALFVINAMSPADVVSIVIDEDAHSMDVAVKEENLAQAIGTNGQNVRLASQLTGWTLNVMSEAEAAEKQARENRKLVAHFVDQLGVDEEIGAILVEAGFSTIDEVAYVPREELLAIEEFDEDLVRQLRDRAKDVLLTRAIANEEVLEQAPPQNLRDLADMDERLEEKLRQQGITTLDALAEQSVDELVERTDVDEALAARLIMQAREPWFAQSEQKPTPTAAVEKALPQNLQDLADMDERLEEKLRQQGITTLDALAEQSVDELVERTGVDEALAARLIMQAREPWFAQAENE